MGRYYSGDIEGKFWFGVQKSNDADFFGVCGSEPNYLEYYFSEENLPEVKKGIKKCKKALGEYEEKLNKFFKKNNYYNEKMLFEEFRIKEDKIKYLIEWYARLVLGEKIAKCIKENGECNFDAEC